MTVSVVSVPFPSYFKQHNQFSFLCTSSYPQKIYTILIFFKNGKRKSLGLKCSVLSQGQKLLGVICIKYAKRTTRRKNDKREQILYPCFCQRKVWRRRMTWLARFVFQLALSGCIKAWTPRIKTKVEHILV